MAEVGGVRLLVRTVAVGGLVVVGGCVKTTPPKWDLPATTTVQSIPSTPSTVRPMTMPSSSTSTTSTTSSTSTLTTTTTLVTAPPSSVAMSTADAAVAAFVAGKRAIRQCDGLVPQCDPSGLSLYLAEPNLSGYIEKTLADNANGVVLRNQESAKTFLRSAQVIDERHVTITFCAEDGVIRAVPTATGDSVLDDSFGSSVIEAYMKLGDDGIWRWASYQRLSLQTGQEGSLCAGDGPPAA